jgi:hypothetical protein
MRFCALRSAVLALSLAVAGASSAATVNIVGGTAGSTPSSSSKAVNDALKPLGFGKKLDGYYGAAITLSGRANVTFTLLGYEAGFRNQLVSGVNVLTGGGGKLFNVNGLGSFSLSDVGAGLLSFSFKTSGGNQSVANGSNPDNTGNNPFPGVNFFASTATKGNLRSGTSLWLFFDDDGANNDDDHDDLVARVDVAPVPVPAAGLLLVGALGGLAALRRRHRV